MQSSSLENQIIENALNSETQAKDVSSENGALKSNIDRSNIYRVIEGFTLGKIKSYDTVTSLQKIGCKNISTRFDKPKLTVLFTGYDGRNYTMQTRSEVGLTPIASYEVTSIGNRYETKIFTGEAIDKNKDKAMSIAYSTAIYEPLQNLFEQLFGYKPEVVTNGYANGGRIYGESLGVSDYKPNISGYNAFKDKQGHWHVQYQTIMNFTYDTGLWREPKFGDIFEDPENNVWEYKDDELWHIIYTNFDKPKTQNFIFPTARPYLLSDLTSQMYD